MERTVKNIAAEAFIRGFEAGLAETDVEVGGDGDAMYALFLGYWEAHIEETT